MPRKTGSFRTVEQPDIVSCVVERTMLVRARHVTLCRTETEVRAHSSVGDVRHAIVAFYGEIRDCSAKALGHCQFQAHIVRRLQQDLLVLEWLNVAILLQHYPAASMVNLVLVKTEVGVSGLALGCDALVL